MLMASCGSSQPQDLVHMPTEIRKIVFSNEELKKAIVLFSHRSVNKLPEGDLISCEVTSIDGINVRIKIRPWYSEGEKIVVLSSTYIGAALSNYCMDCKIPIPRHAAKSLQIIGDNIALQINIEMAEKKIFEVVIEEKEENNKSDVSQKGV